MYYTVQWFDGQAVTFAKKKDAQQFQKLLRLSVEQSPSGIVRREITDEGFEPTYGERK